MMSLLFLSIAFVVSRSRNDSHLGSRLNFLPEFPNVPEGATVRFQIANKFGNEVLRGQTFGLFFGEKLLNCFLVVVLQQLEDFVDVLLADVDVAFLKLIDYPLVGLEEAV